MSEATAAPAAAPAAAAPIASPGADAPTTNPQSTEASEDQSYKLTSGERLQRAKKAARETLFENGDVEEPSEGKPAEASGAEPDPDLEKARAERKARVDALRAAERDRRAKDEARKAQKPREDDTDHVRIPKAKLVEWEALERSLSDPVAILDLAEKRGVDPQAFGNTIGERLRNPDKVAELRARKVYEDGSNQWEKKLSERDDRIAALEQRLQQQDDAQVEAAAANAFRGFVEQNARVAPLSAQYLKRHGEREFLRFATELAQYCPEGSGPQALHDLIEQTLENYQLGSAGPSTAKANPTPPQPKANTATTVTNSLASEQSAVPDEDAYALLSPGERLRIVKARR